MSDEVQKNDKTKANLRNLELGQSQYATANFQSGELIGGRYRVFSLLGRGGMGTVYEVEQIFQKKKFALKTLNKSSISDIAIKRFQLEARTTFNLDHPNLIKVHDYGLLDNETPFLVMDLIDGKTLAEHIRNRGKFILAEAVPIFVQICGALAYAHEQGVVHRDIKPSNIMILNQSDSANRVTLKVVDFGIAKLTQRDGGEIQGLTRTGEIFGSPLYMSPEQCEGGRIDQRSDIYSIGCVFFEALTGAPPFVGENALATMMQHQMKEAPTLKQASIADEFPEALENLLSKMLAKNCDDRYQDLKTVAHDLAGLSRDQTRLLNEQKAASLSVMSEITDTLSSADSKSHLERYKPVAIVTGLVLLSALAWLIGYLIQPEPTNNLLATSTAPQNTTVPAPAKTELVDDMADFNVRFDESPGLLKAQLARAKQHTFKTRDKKISANSLAMIAETPGLMNLDLLGCEIANDSLGKLAKLPLRRISLTESNLDDIGATELAHCQALRIIKIGATKVTDRGIAAFATMKQLEEIKMDGTAVTYDGLTRLCRSNKSLKKLFLRDCPQLSDKQLKQLKSSYPSINFVRDPD